MNAKTQPAVIFPGGSSVVHAGRIAGRYASGEPRYSARCGRVSANYHPMRVDGKVTCKRCLVKLAGDDR